MYLKFIFVFLIKISHVFTQCQEGLNDCSICNPLTHLCTKCSLDIYSPNNEGGCSPTSKCFLGKNYCLKCEETGKNCLECQKGLVPDENGGCSFVNNCKISYKGHCLKFIEDFILVGEVCKSLELDDFVYCKRINNLSGLCEECKEGYFLNSGDMKCSYIDNCFESTLGKCISCKSGYYLDISEDQCKKYGDKDERNSLLFCDESLDGKACEKCEDNFYFDSKGNCVGINYCEERKEYLCNKCIEGYYFNKYRDTCVTDPNCALGDRLHGLCNTCDQNYYLDLKDRKCKSNKEENNFKFCEKAEDNNCISCIFQYNLSEDGRCTNTKFCSEVENGICFSCIDGYFLGLDNKCTFVEHCIYSEYDNECKECEEGYYYNKTNKACLEYIKGFENCRITSINGDYCASCKKNFYLNQTDYLCYSNNDLNSFYKCLLTDTTGTLCIKCEENYFIGIKDSKCTKIEHCEISNVNECIQFERKYAYNKKEKKCENNDKIISNEKKFLFKCNVTNAEGTYCEICLYGYTLKDGLCVNDRYCSEKNENDDDCIKCSGNELDNYCLNNYFGCMQTTVLRCDECNNILNFDECTKCEEGYELNENRECI